MRILFVSYCFAPLQFPQTYVLLKWFKHLREQGHAVTVVCVDPDSFPGSKDETLHALVPEGVQIVTAPSRENHPGYRLLRRAEPLFMRLFQPFKKEWLSASRRVANNLPLDSFDVVMSCSQPPVCHLLAQDIAKKAGLPWVAYFSDPWVDGPYRRNASPRIQRYNQRLEAMVVEKANTLIFPTDEMRQMVLRKYSEDAFKKSTTLGHCYVPQWFEQSTVAARREPAPFRIVHAGNFYGPRTARPLADAIKRLQSERGSRPIMFDFYGRADAKCFDGVEGFNGDGMVNFHGPVDYLKSLALMRQADMLLLIDAPLDDESESVFFPSKLAEYLGAGRPILGLTPQAGVSARILRETGHVTMDVSDSAELSDVILAEATQPSAASRDHLGGERFDYRRIGSELENILAGAGRV